MASSSKTLLSTIEWAKRFNFGKNPAIGSSLEPALTSATLVMQTMLGPPFCWRWNRVTTGFFTQQGRQDYIILGAWNTNTIFTTGQYLVDNLGNSQKVVTSGTSGGSYPTFNSVQGANTTDGSVVWSNAGNFPTAGIDFTINDTYTFNWIETTSISDGTRWYDFENKNVLGLESIQSRPKFISPQFDDGQGNIGFRLMPNPDKAYPVVITIQQKPPLFTSLNQTWSPIPDEYGYIYNWGFLALMWMYSDDSRFMFANQKFVASLLASNEGLTETEINIFLNNWQYVTGQPVQKATRSSQGEQSRGV